METKENSTVEIGEQNWRSSKIELENQKKYLENQENRTGELEENNWRTRRIELKIWEN